MPHRGPDPGEEGEPDLTPEEIAEVERLFDQVKEQNLRELRKDMDHGIR
jgi:hypothetical protein